MMSALFPLPTTETVIPVALFIGSITFGYLYFSQILRKRKQLEAKKRESSLYAKLADYRENPSDFGKLIALGDIYHHGIFGLYKPDRDSAALIYMKAMESPDAIVSAYAHSKLLDVKTRAVSHLDSRGDQMPVTVAVSA